VIWIERHAGRQRGLMQQDGVAVRFGLCCFVGGDHAAGAADILDHDRLVKRLLQGLLDHASGRIINAAGRERHDHGDGTIWIVVGQSRADHQSAGS
jgi:hypothetical protein